MERAPLPPGYPTHRVADVGLLDGSTMRVRPVMTHDSERIYQMFARLTDDSLRLRFHGLRRITAKDADNFADADYGGKFGLLAERQISGEMHVVALANYIQTGESKAEMSVVVEDDFHGLGLGSLLIEHLSEAAEEAGIETFVAEVLGDNFGMLGVVRQSELPRTAKTSGGVVHFEFPTSATSEALEAFELREANAAAASLRIFFEPRSVAVVGASRKLGTIGGELFRNILRARFVGPVFPINPKSEVVQSVVAYPSVAALPGPVDLAVVVVPSSAVVGVATECGEKGVKALLVISSGFAEVGTKGLELQDELVEVARSYGMRIIGPNCMGIINPNPLISLNATFAPNSPPDGKLAFSSQSGALGISIIDAMQSLGLGMSSFVSVGNKADISGNDLLQYWERDARTEVILLYLESFGNPRKFARIARRVGRKKPIVAVKSGRSKAGARAAASHTGSLAEGDIAVDALFRQAGVIRTDTLEEMFDVAGLLAHQPLPRGNRVGILTNAGGLGILAADACEAAGLVVPELSEETTKSLRDFLPVEASVSNPVDMIASATAEHYGKALRVLANDTNTDALIVIFIPPLVTRAEDVATAIAEGSKTISKTVVSCFMGSHGIHDQLRSENQSVPSYAFPESAARALAKVASYSSWRKRPEGILPKYEGIDRAAAMAVASRAVQSGVRWLPQDEVGALLEAYGISIVRTIFATTPRGVSHAASELGVPVAVKVDSPNILHKTDVGGVKLNLKNPDEAEASAEAMLRRLSEGGHDLTGFVVSEMIVDQGAELFVGMTFDPTFGPLLACGAGGTLVELIRDVAVRITPLTELDAKEMFRSLKTFPLFEGFRGSPILDIEAAEELLLRVSTMVEDIPQLRELDLNPVLVKPKSKGCVVLDARIHLERVEPAAPRGARLGRGTLPRIQR